MFNDDVLAKCPECGSSDSTILNEVISCSACGFSELLVLDDQAREEIQNEIVNAMNIARARDVLQRWSFAG
ncbi:hypothetical protein [Ruegeria profundi]|uniref:hypothetical protein n=1 Tax=Ruegeria profundi TaxID=1685378 RepID=UPI003C7A31CE